METKFENKTSYSKEMIMQYYLYHINHSFLHYFLIVLAILLSLSQFSSYYYTGELFNLIFAFGYLIAISLVYLLNYVIVKVKSKKYISDTKLNYEYYFYEDKFIAKSSETTNYTYKDIYKVKIDKDLIYVYINKNSALIIAEKSFIKGTSTEFTTFITKILKQR